MRKTILISFIFLALYGVSLQDIVIKPGEEGTEVLLSLDGHVSYTDFTIGEKIVLDLLEVTSAFDGAAFEVGRGGVKTITLSPVPSANLLRVVITGESAYTYTVNMVDGGVLLVLNTGQKDFEEWRASGSSYNPPPREEKVAVPEDHSALISLDLENADLLTVLRSIADYAGMNLVVGEGIKGNVTVRLVNVPWERALSLILKSKGYTYIIEGNVIRVGTGEQFAKEREARELAEPLVRKVYRLEFAKPKELEGIIKPILSKRGTINIDERTNSLIVTDIDSRQREVEELISLLDTETPQVEIQVKVVDIDRDVVQELGIDWSVVNLTFGDVAGSVVRGAPVELAEYSGIALNLATLRSFAKLTSIITALEQENKLNVLANPRIVTTNNRKASIFGGKRVAIPVTSPQTGVTYEWTSAGIKLDVIPHINSANEILLELVAELSEMQATDVITETKAETEALVKDGETLVIGGFIHYTETMGEEGVPILRNLPLIGRLFKRTTKEKKEREVLIFLTPHIVKRY